jgi:hypothetical protein
MPDFEGKEQYTWHWFGVLDRDEVSDMKRTKYRSPEV